MTFTRFKVLPDGLRARKVKVDQRDADFADGVIAADTIMVKDLHVQGPTDQFTLGKTWNDQS